MGSEALRAWRSSGLDRLSELSRLSESAIVGRAEGGWAADQLQHSLYVALVAQFQTYCRQLHDEAIAVHLALAHPRQRDILRRLATHGRLLDRHTPRASSLGSDFARIGISILDAVGARGSCGRDALTRLDVIVDFRNAIVHGHEEEALRIGEGGTLLATPTGYGSDQRMMDRLASIMDEAVSSELRRVLHIDAPW